jgi:hypothetical protein
MEWLNGRKTYVGVIVWGVVQVLMTVKPEWMDVLKMVEVSAMALFGVGVGHKLAKAS